MGDWYDDFEIGGVLEGIIDVVEGISDAANGRTSTYTQRNWIDKEVHEKELVRNGGWCCRCGNINASYVGTCKCGGTKQDDAVSYDAAKREKDRITNYQMQASQRQAPTSGWMCECGKRNTAYQAYCSCGGAQTDGIPYAEYLETSPIRMRSIEPANRTPVQTPPVAKPVEERTAAPVCTEAPKPAEPVIPMTEPETEPLIPIAEPEEKSVFTRPKEENRAPITEKPEEKEREDIFGLKPKPTGNKRFENPFYDREAKDWKCSKCGAIRPSFMAICECGTSKRRN